MLAVLDKLIKCTLVINVTDSETIELRPEWPRVRRFERPYKESLLKLGRISNLISGKQAVASAIALNFKTLL